MRNRVLLSLTSVALLFGVLEHVCAEPVTYRFVGSVNNIFNGDPAIVDGIIAVGDTVEFTFECDQDRDGSLTMYDGTVIVQVDRDTPANRVDPFWCEYLGGTEIGPIGEITAPDPNYYESWNYGLAVFRKNDAGDIVQRTSYQYGGSSYNWVSIENYSQNINDWQVGSGAFSFRVIVRNQADQYTWIRGAVVLAFMSDAQQPEPPEATQDLIDETMQLISLENLSESEHNKLINPLSAAAHLIDKGHYHEAINLLGNFIRKVERYIARGRISEDEGWALIDAANSIIEQLLL